MSEAKINAGRSTSLSAEIEEQHVECLKALAGRRYLCNRDELCGLVAINICQIKTA